MIRTGVLTLGPRRVNRLCWTEYRRVARAIAEPGAEFCGREGFAEPEDETDVRILTRHPMRASGSDDVPAPVELLRQAGDGCGAACGQVAPVKASVAYREVVDIEE